MSGWVSSSPSKERNTATVCAITTGGNSSFARRPVGPYQAVAVALTHGDAGESFCGFLVGKAGVQVVASWLVPDKKGISEMPPQAVTLEPLVQGECVVTVLRLLGRTEHAHQPRSATFLWYEISAQGTGPLANISEKFCLHGYSTTVNRKVSFKVLVSFFGDATLFK